MTVPPGAELVPDPATLIGFYADHRAAHVYALVDLEEPFWSLSRWYRRGNAVVGLVSMPPDPNSSTTSNAVYAVSTRDPDGRLELLVQLLPQLRPGQLITGPIGLGDALRPHRELEWDMPMERYHLARPEDLPPPDERVVPLGRSDLPALVSLYESDPGAAFFLPHMIDDQGFVGVFDGPDLVAAAGTHVLSESQRCAAIGAVYSRPSHRGQGLGAAVTAGAAHRILGRVDTVGLNVATGNIAARTIYETIGFDSILTYEEAQLV